MKHYKLFGILLIAIALSIFVGVTFRNSKRAHQSIVYSPAYMLNALWQSYKKNYIEQSSGRTLDTQRDNITTSEGQSYTMLRSVWADDKTTFDTSWNWTKQNLQRPGDNLFYWLFGQKPDGSYGILNSQGGENSATDADTDIALALILASRRWQDDNYLEEAKKIIPNIWQEEVVTINNVPFISADNLEKNSEKYILINPSYFAPYAYKMFSSLDPAHPWDQVVESSYNVIEQSMAQNLDAQQSAIIPPDWIAIDKTTGELTAPKASSTTTNFGYDAMRLPFRLAIDYQWTNSLRAKNLLEKMKFLGTQWQIHQQILATYKHDGSENSNIEAPALYGGTLGYFITTNSEQAKEVYTNKIQSLYSSDNQDWAHPMSYYDDNWVWFGMALYNSKIINFNQK